MELSKYQEYLGDGVYAWWDGYQVWVQAERDGIRHEIALEPEVLLSLAKYWNNVQRKVKNDK
jgi:hypothetical protein